FAGTMTALAILLQNRKNVLIESDFRGIRRSKNHHARQATRNRQSKCIHANRTSFRGAPLPYYIGTFRPNATIGSTSEYHLTRKKPGLIHFIESFDWTPRAPGLRLRV